MICEYQYLSMKSIILNNKYFSWNFFINTQKELLFNGTRKVETAMVMVDKAK